MEKKDLTPAPIDNRNVLEDFADEMQYFAGDGTEEKKTFWFDHCLYVIDYVFGTNQGEIYPLYGEPKTSSLKRLKAMLDDAINESSQGNGFECDFALEHARISFAFYFKP